MAVVQNLYQIFKIPASSLVEQNCCIEKYTIQQAEKDGNLVSIGDNIIFQQIRYHNNDFREHNELYDYVANLRSSVHYYKRHGEYRKAHVLEQKINKVLFVKEIINVYVDKKKSDFDKFRVQGFYVNGVHYSYLCSGSGQIRRNTATFIETSLRDKIVKTINCGLDEKTSEFVLAKYSAYFALAFSSILWVRTPRVCVIKDFYNTLKNEKVDFICKDSSGKSIIEERVMDIELNGADGQGLIDPEFAKLWASDMQLPYVPCSFVARSCFIKGNLATFDFREYAHRNGITTIKDKWGMVYNIDEIDVLLSESQFKTHKYYSSWQEYVSYAEAGKIHWGVARYNKQRDEEFVLANYQYIQALTLEKEDIEQLIQPTVDWIQKICSGDTLYTLLYCFGPKDEDIKYHSLYGTAQTTAMKAIIKNCNFLSDSYVQHKIYKNISESINKAKIGKIWIRGNYQFMIADPVAQVQSALGLKVTGLVGPNQIYSNFWRTRQLNGDIIDCCRSPMIDQHEHNPMSIIKDNPEADYWYQYLYSGIIYGIYDSSCFRHEDADYDGDIVLSTDNEFFIKGSHKDHNIITYEKGLALPSKMTINNITATVKKGFGTGVGGFSNTATTLYAMAAMFNKPNQTEQHDEIMLRIKLLREIVGQEIDRIKGADKPFLPQDWKKFIRIEEGDTQEQVLAKLKHNSMIVAKKPYFFRYLYPDLNREFKEYENAYNQVAKDSFGTKFKKLLKTDPQELTEAQKTLIKRYYKYSPLITSDCTMNRLCKQFENVDFDIRFSKDRDTDKRRKVVSLLPTFATEFTYEEEKFLLIRSCYRTYLNRPQIKRAQEILVGSFISADDSEYLEFRKRAHQQNIETIQLKIGDSGISWEEFLFYCHHLSLKYPTSFNWGFAWDVLEDKILDFIPQGKTLCPIRTLPDDPQAHYFLGEYYKLEDVTNREYVLIEYFVNALFGLPQDFSFLQEDE